MIAVLGPSGMLGNMVMNHLSGDVVGLGRPEFDAEKPYDLTKYERIVNCVGVIKPYCGDVRRAVAVNSLFPQSLPPKTIQIATDCVYDGQKGNYVETDAHNATDVYGKTKSLGEAAHLYNIRCSIIGPELKTHSSLLDWFLAQEDIAQGFTNHLWNGVTTLHFARVADGAIRSGVELPAIQHLVPADIVTKYELLQIIAEVYRKDISIRPVAADESIDRTLATNNPQLNKELWRLAGYSKPPTIREMLEELAAL